MHKTVRRCNLEEEVRTRKEVIFVSAIAAAAATHELVMITVKSIERI
jgi:hypothetical protein